MKQGKKNYTFQIPEVILNEKNRRFSGVAYSGGLVDHPWWGPVVFDLSSTSAKPKIPALIGHDREKRAGFTESVDITNDIKIQGKILSNKFGNSVAQDADEGFPWQVSVDILPKQIVELTVGFSREVNGEMINGPATIFIDNVIKEVSFTPTGVDGDTQAEIFESNINDNREVTKMDEVKVKLESLREQVKDWEVKCQAETLRADTAEKALSVYREESRDTAIQELSARTGKKFSQDNLAVLKGMSEETFKFCASAIPDKDVKSLPANLFSVDGGFESPTPSEVNPLIESAKARAGTDK